ncbi:hypothetical protein GCM10028806_36230 [Spirosoma terrae]
MFSYKAIVTPMKVLLPFFLLLSVQLLAQVTLPTNELGQVQYQEIVRLPDATRPTRQVATQLRSWVDQQYPNEGDAEKHYDQENNVVFAKSVFLIDGQTVRYTLTLEAKFGRYRVTLTDLITEAKGLSLPVQATSPTADEMSRMADNKTKSTNVIQQAVKQQEDLYRQLNKECRATLANLKEYMISLAEKKSN